MAARKPAEDAASKPRLIDGQNRVALPPEVLSALGVKSGDYVAFEVKGADVSVHRVKWALDKK